jgi:DNA modification methylase
MEFNKVYCADNLKIMQLMASESIDLIYIDPPFNTGRLQRNKKHEHSFSDCFKNLDAYLSFMQPRLQQMHRLLKNTGSLFVHVDYRVVHYLKVELDKIFSPKNFINEIIWHYSSGGGKSLKSFKKRHDTILWYAKNKNNYYFCDSYIRLPYTPHKQNSSGKNYGGTMGRDANGREYVEKWGTGKKKKYRYYIDKGKMPEDVWLDIKPLNSAAKERTGYPTQKPIKLLQRIILATTQPNDIVADFFCGSGTTCKAAELLNRKYLGIDSNPQAIDLFVKHNNSNVNC